MTFEAGAKMSDERSARRRKFPLSAAQTPICLDQLFFPDRPIANTGDIIRIAGAIDPQLFAEAVRRVVEETEAIRVAITVDGDAIAQNIRELTHYAIEQIDVSAAHDPQATAEAWIERHFWTPIGWNAFPLFRLALLKLGGDRFIFLQKFNHLIGDAIGRQLFAQRVAEMYESLRCHRDAAPIIPRSIAALAAEETDYLRSEKYAADRAYWKERFSSIPDPLMDTDHTKTERAKSGRAARISFALAPADFEHLGEIAKSLGSTPPRLFLTFAYIAFARLYDKNDFVLGFPFHNRTTELAKRSIGLAMQVVPFRIAVGPETPFAGALQQIGAALGRDSKHSRFPFASLGPIVGLKGGRGGLADAIVNYVPAPPPLSFADVEADFETYSAGFFAPWMIDMRAKGTGAGARLTIDFDPGLIPADEASRLANCLYFLLTNGIAEPAQPIKKLPIIGPEERKRLLVDLNDNFVDVPKHATLATLCARQAERTPHAIAVTHGRENIDYATLHKRAAALASRLVAFGVGPDIIVGLALPRSIDLIVAILAIHKAGGAYLPLDPAYPPERLAYIIADARAPIIVTTHAFVASLPETAARLVLLDDTERDASPEIGVSREIVAAKPENLAYVIYTSGSTGQPKGVAVEHRNAVNLVLWCATLHEPQELAGALFSTSLNFDVSVDELFPPLVRGGRVILVENLLAVATAPARDEVRVFGAVPSMMEALLQIDGYPRRTKAINLGGEPASRSLTDRIFARDPNVRVRNFYGPTETTVDSTWSLVQHGGLDEPPIGKGIWNTQLYVLDRNRELLPQGAKGELYIGGAGVARGYLHKAELTAERFLQNPFREGRIYRTGDLVRWRTDGELEFLSRADTQIKINGLRVELGEIEKQLEALPAIRDAVAIVCPDKFGVKRIYGYAISRTGHKKPEFEAIISQLNRILPRHMIPSALIWMEAFPLTPNGKLDRKALPPPDQKIASRTHRAPSDDIERTLARIWQETLKIAHVGIEDDFYDLGGTSLQAFMTFARIATSLGCDLPPTTMIDAPTIARQAELLRANALSPTGSSKLIPFRERGQGSPLFVVHGGLGDIMFVKEIVRDLRSDRPVYGIQPPPLDGTHPISRTMETTATNYLAEIRKIQPEGPYYLAGYSFGGWVALEMAQQLARKGEHVAFLGIIDTLARWPEPSASRVRRHMRELTRNAIVFYLATRVKKTLAHRLALAREAARHMPNEIRMRLGRPVPYEERAEFYEHIYTVAGRRYAARTYPGHVVVFSSIGQTELQRTRWSMIAPGKVTVHEIPGNHGNLVWPPHSTRLAEALDESLDAAASRR